MRTNWKSVNIYKYFYSGISNSDEIQYLNIPPKFIKNLYTYAYISEIPYIDNLMGVTLTSNHLSKTSFSYSITLTYGQLNNKDNIKSVSYVNHKDKSSTVIKTFYGYSFLINIGFEMWSTRDRVWGKIRYRYTLHNVTSEWEEIYYNTYKDDDGSTVVDHKQDYINHNFYPLTEEALFEVEITLGSGSLSLGVMNVDILLYNYIEKTLKQGKLHWFAFIE